MEKAQAERLRWRVAVIEDHLLQRRATESIIASDPGLDLVWSGPTIKEYWVWLRAQPMSRSPHLVVMDLLTDHGPRVKPRDITELSVRGIRTLVLSALSARRVVREIVCAGVDGVVSKRDDEASIRAAVWAVLEGRTWRTPELAAMLETDAMRPHLSDQEQRTLALYASGKTLDAVASELNVKPNTAKKYLSRVKTKYAAVGRHANSKIDLSRVAREDGYLY